MPDFFGGLTNRSLEKLEGVQKRRTVAAGSILFLEDEEGRLLYRLISGSIRLFRSTPDGREVTIHLVEPGDLFAEIVLFERDTYPASAAAISVRPETLSRVLSRVDDAGLLRWKRGTIQASPEFWKRGE